MKVSALLHLLILVLSGVLVGSISSCKPAGQRIESDAPKQPFENNQIGMSIDKAIIIKAKSLEEMVLMENEWIKKIYPTSVPLSKAPIKIDDDNDIISFTHYVNVIDNHVYSIHNVSLPDGTTKSVYFDITEFYYKGQAEGVNPSNATKP